MLTRQILKIAAAVAAAALFIGLLVSFWISARITKPVEELAEGAREVASGRWDTHIDVHGRDEIGQLAEAFNHMTQTLAAQKERLVQTSALPRGANWRGVSRTNCATRSFPCRLRSKICREPANSTPSNS